MPSVDLTTLPGWASLSAKTYDITVVAKAIGYRDSEPSAAVSVEKAEAQPGYTVTRTSWDEEVGADDGAAVKFNTPPTSENDYDYRTGKLYDDTGLYNASGAKVTQPIIVDGVTKVYVFMYANYTTSAGGYKLNGGSVEYGGIWSNPAVISLTKNSTLSLLHAQN